MVENQQDFNEEAKKEPQGNKAKVEPPSRPEEQGAPQEGR